jgi:recA bacterial DNA recombination protein
MPAHALADLEALLRTKRLDGTLTSSLPLARPEHTVASSGVPQCDARLGGGWPRGQVSEIAGPASAGRTLVAASSLAAATRRGELAALVDAADTFDPPSAAVAGIAWSHLLWIRGAPATHGRATREVLDRMVERAIKAASLVLSAGGFGLVVLDLADVPAIALRRVPFTTWLRLQRMVEGRETVVLLLTPFSLGRSTGGVSVSVSPSGARAAPGRWQGALGRARLFTGVTAQATLRRARPLPGDDEAFEIGPSRGAGPSVPGP